MSIEAIFRTGMLPVVRLRVVQEPELTEEGIQLMPAIPAPGAVLPQYNRNNQV